MQHKIKRFFGPPKFTVSGDSTPTLVIERVNEKGNIVWHGVREIRYTPNMLCRMPNEKIQRILMYRYAFSIFPNIKDIDTVKKISFIKTFAQNRDLAKKGRKSEERSSIRVLEPDFLPK